MRHSLRGSGVISLDKLTSDYALTSYVDAKQQEAMDYADTRDSFLAQDISVLNSFKSETLEWRTGAELSASLLTGHLMELDSSAEALSSYAEQQRDLAKAYAEDQDQALKEDILTAESLFRLSGVYATKTQLDTAVNNFHTNSGDAFIVFGSNGNDLYVSRALDEPPQLVGPATCDGLKSTYATKDELHSELDAKALEVSGNIMSDIRENEVMSSTKKYNGNIRTNHTGNKTHNIIYREYQGSEVAYGYDYYFCNEDISEDKFQNEFSGVIPVSALTLIGGCTKKQFSELSSSVVYTTQFDNYKNNVYLKSEIDSKISTINGNIASTNNAIDTAVQGLSQQVAGTYATKAYADEIETTIRYAVVDTGTTFGAGSYTDIDNLQGSGISVYGGLWQNPVAGTELPNVIIYNSNAVNASTSAFKDLSIPKLTVSKAREVEVWFGYQQTGALSGKKLIDASNSSNNKITCNLPNVYLDAASFSNVGISVESAGSYVYYKFNVKFFAGKAFWTLKGVQISDTKLF